ncbi:MAG: CPBP family intramembrane metalloprotease [bacterium]|nr:CPBP family intramembrane metalloprotease [bacterium]
MEQTEQTQLTYAEKNRKAVILFLIIVISISAIVETVTIITGIMAFVALMMWAPALAAFIAKQKYFKGEKGVLLFKKCKWKYIGLGLLYPLIYLGLPYVIYWIANPGTLQMGNATVPFLVVSALIGIPISLITALGEEIGWRGFLVPRMVQWLGLEKTLLITGLIWSLWHCPLLISGMYMPGTPVWYKVPVFVILIGTSSAIFSILTLRCKSVWPAALMHAAHNDFDQTIFAPITTGDNKMFWVSETGLVTLAVVIVLTAWVYLSYKKSLQAQIQQDEAQSA